MLSFKSQKSSMVGWTRSNKIRYQISQQGIRRDKELYVQMVLENFLQGPLTPRDRTRYKHVAHNTWHMTLVHMYYLTHNSGTHMWHSTYKTPWYKTIPGQKYFSPGRERKGTMSTIHFSFFLEGTIIPICSFYKKGTYGILKCRNAVILHFTMLAHSSNAAISEAWLSCWKCHHVGHSLTILISMSWPSYLKCYVGPFTNHACFQGLAEPL